MWGFPKITGTFLGDPYKTDYSFFGGSILGYPNLGNYHVEHHACLEPHRPAFLLSQDTAPCKLCRKVVRLPGVLA